jgi:hypothetical protein
MTLQWSPPTPETSHRAGTDPVLLSPAAPRTEPPLWSMRRTALAIAAAVVAGVLTIFGVSYADTGSGDTGAGSRFGGLGGPGGRNLSGGGLPGGPGGFGQAGQLPGGRSGTGQAGTGQAGTGLAGLGQPQPGPTFGN